MNQTIIWAIVCLSSIGIVAAVVLYFVAQKFKVIEDPRIDQIADLLPSANCGGCGFAGCRNLAEVCVKQGNTDNIFCPVGGNEILQSIAVVLGVEAESKEPKVAVVRCAGSKTAAIAKTSYDGISNCQFAHNLFSGESGCPHGCLGLGDCVFSCKFDAIKIDTNTGLPVVVDEKCTACGACTKACPRKIIELRNKAPKDRKIFVSCVNQEKGAAAKKNCEVACIGCGKCQKICPHDAITINNNLAFIDSKKCKLCRKCVSECPTNAILEMNFPAKKAAEVNYTE